MGRARKRSRKGVLTAPDPNPDYDWSQCCSGCRPFCAVCREKQIAGIAPGNCCDNC